MYGYCSNNPVRYIDPDGRVEVISDKGVLSDNPYEVTGIFLGELCYKSPLDTYNQLREAVQKAGLMGKVYDENSYVCTSFGKDGIRLLGLDVTEYFPRGNLVRDNLSDLKKDNSVFELRREDTLTSGIYVFYKIYDNDYNGHTGFLYVDDEGNQTVLHNGWNPSGEECVNEFNRGKSNFNDFFKSNKKNTVYLKPILVFEGNYDQN